MGTKVQFENHLHRLCSMRSLNHESDGTHWTLFYGENNLPNQQYCYSLLPRPPVDSSPGADKDTLKHTILKHEAIFKDQVIELHRLYRVQKDLMYKIQRKEQYTHRIPYEAASSSSVFPLQTTPEDAHRQNSSSFLFTNSVCEGPQIQLSGGSPLKGKGIYPSSIPLQKCGSPRGSEVSKSRPKKLRKTIDLEFPADEYVDVDEVEQQSNGEIFNSGEKLFPSHLGKCECENDVFGSDSCLRKPCALADLNEPVLSEETNVNPSVNIFPWNSKQANKNTTINSSQYNDKGNAHQWFPSMIKEAGMKDDVRSIDQTNHLGKASISPSPVQNAHQQAYIFSLPHPVKEDMWPAKANVGFKMSDRSQEALLPSQLPSYVPSSDLANSWDHSCGMPNSHLSQKSFPVQSLIHCNKFLGKRWHMINQDQFYNAARACVNGFVDKATSGSGNVSKGLNSIDLNTALPNGLSEEQLAKQCVKSVDCEVKREDLLSALPWLRPKGGASSTSEAASERSGSNRPESSLFHMPNELLKRGEVGNLLSRQNSFAVSSCDVEAAREKDRVISDHPSCSRKIIEVPIFQSPSFGDEIESRRRKWLLDINIPCDDPDVFDAAVASEIIVQEKKTETGHSSSIRNMFDLNSCAAEDKFPSRSSLTNSSTTANSMERDERAIIDLEAPINLENEEDEPSKNQQLPLQGAIDSSKDEESATVAAEAIVSISTCTGTIRPRSIEEASGSEDALQWFVDIVCSAPDDAKSCPDDDEDCLSCESDYFEEMTLKLTECTVDEYFPSPPVFNIPATEEPSPSSCQIRRGPTRRGRQRRDFQRDILPGLTSLARNEVTEDLQTFGGLMRATGHTWHCRSTSRKGAGRGRRRSAAVIPPPVPPPVASLTSDIMLEDRSLSSWGKTTRRPRRQRCPSATPGNLTYVALA